MYIAIGIAFLVVIVLLFRWRVSEFVGEEMFDSYLGKLAPSGKVIEGIVFDNQTMAPYLYVSKQGVFNIYYNPELTGRLYGRDDDMTWSHVMGHRKINFPNPVKTMMSQHEELQKISESLELEFPVYNMMCFSKRLVLKINTRQEVVYLKEFIDAIESKSEVLTDAEVARIVSQIKI